MAGPLVSIVLPVYNAASYLPQTLDSLARQTHDDYELIAIDDGSSDESLSILESYRAADDRIRIISRENRGISRTLNEGIEAAHGELIARMDADDIAYPERLAKQVALMTARPTLALCGTHVDYLISDSRVLRVPASPVTGQEIAIMTIFDPVFVHPTVMFRAQAIRAENGPYSTDYPHCEDFELFRRLAASCEAALIPEPLLAFRINHPSVRTRHAILQNHSHYRVVAENVQRLKITSAGILEETTRPGRDLMPADAERLAACLREIDALAPRFAAHEATFAFAYRRFVSHLFESLLLRHPTGEITRIFSTPALTSQLGRRTRMLATLSRLVPAETAQKLRGTAVAAGQRLRSRPLPI